MSGGDNQTILVVGKKAYYGFSNVSLRFFRLVFLVGRNAWIGPGRNEPATRVFLFQRTGIKALTDKIKFRRPRSFSSVASLLRPERLSAVRIFGSVKYSFYWSGRNFSLAVSIHERSNRNGERKAFGLLRKEQRSHDRFCQQRLRDKEGIQTRVLHRRYVLSTRCRIPEIA